MRIALIVAFLLAAFGPLFAQDQGTITGHRAASIHAGKLGTRSSWCCSLQKLLCFLP
jgi:hypothetical protein